MGELQGIVQQVGEDLAQPGGIANHRQRGRGVHIQAQLQALGPGLEAQHRLHILHHGQQIEVQGLEDQLPGLDLGEVEDVVDEGQQGLAAGADGLGILPLLIAQGRVQEEPGHANDAVHGGADLVAHVGQELALKPRGCHGPVPGLGQLSSGLLQAQLRPTPLRDVVVLPEVAQVLVPHQDRHEVPGQDAAIQ